MPKVSPIHNVPQPPENVSSRFPASAMETGSHATARPSEIHDNFRSTERCRLNSTAIPARPDRKSVVQGKSVSVRVDLGGCRIINKQKKITTMTYMQSAQSR